MSQFKSFSEFCDHHTKARHALVGDCYSVETGDFLTYWNWEKNSPEKVMVLDRYLYDGELKVLPIGKKDDFWIHPRNFTLFKVPKESVNNPRSSCECGARHTSFPNKHLFYCPSYKEL